MGAMSKKLFSLGSKNWYHLKELISLQGINPEPCAVKAKALTTKPES